MLPVVVVAAADAAADAAVRLLFRLLRRTALMRVTMTTMATMMIMMIMMIRTMLMMLMMMMMVSSNVPCHDEPKECEGDVRREDRHPFSRNPHNHLRDPQKSVFQAGRIHLGTPHQDVAEKQVGTTG